MSGEASTEAKELTLIGKVEFRIAAAETDVKLEDLLNKYLAPLLLKLASEHVAVRNKVIAVCQHVNTRIKAPSIKLPVADLLKQFKEHQNTLIRHFDLLYIQQGIERLPQDERTNLLPVILHGLATNHKESPKQASALFNLFLRLLPQFKLPPRGSKEDLDLLAWLHTENDNDQQFVAKWIGKLFMYNAAVATTKSCPGLSVSDCEFLQLYDKPETWDPRAPGGLNLIETKVLAAKFLASGAFTDRVRFLSALIASADPNSRLSDLGKDMLKRALPAIDKEDLGQMDALYRLYLGSSAENVLPAPTALQVEILPILSTSQIAIAKIDDIMAIIKTNLAIDQRSGASSVKGLAASKLRTQVFGFVTWIARMGSKSEIIKIAPETVTHLRDYIIDQGWPTVTAELKNNAAELQLRAYGYESIGLLAKACPDKLLYEENMDLLRWFFQSLGGDTSSKDVSLSIEQALSSALGAFSGQNFQDSSTLVHLLSHYASLTIGAEDASGITIYRNTRYVAVRFSNRCLPFSDVNGRMIALLALGGGDTERREVIEEGRRGIDPYWFRILNPVDLLDENTGKAENLYKMPDFEELVSTLLAKNNNPLAGSRAFGDAIVFCWTILLHKALASISKAPSIDADWQRNIEALIHNDDEARDGVKRYLLETSIRSSKAAALLRLSEAAFEDYVASSSAIRPLSGKALVELYQLSPLEVIDLGQALSRASELQATIFSNFQSARVLSSKLIGLMASRPGFSTAKNVGLIEELFKTAQTWELAVGSNVHHVHGSLLALAYGLSRASKAGSCSELTSRANEHFKLVFDILKKTRDKELIEASLLSISQLCLFGLLRPMTIAKYYPLEDLLLKIEESAKKGDENAVATLGFIAMQSDEESEEFPTNKIITLLYSLHETRQAELHFAVGAALSYAAIGWGSKSLIGMFDSTGSPPASAPRSQLLGEIIEKVLSDCKTTKPALRQAAVIWLLCLVQFCGHEETVVTRLGRCQVAFKGFLSDKDSVNQEVASRGLTLVYEKGDKDLKDDLIRDLVTSFTSTKSNLSGNVSEDTQLFEAGALPTEGGQSVTTYKDIISLANEVGDPTLVYRFMSLASNSAIWSSRSAFGRFGLSRILSDASIDGYLAHNPKLYSSLYRYRFDPNTNVRSAMNEIWTSLVKDSKTTIDKYFDNILRDLLRSILNKEWRTRQASCAAIADLLQGRPLAMYEEHLTEIWQLTFKVCDDIKGSVRTAAMALARVLTGILIRSLEAGDASTSTANAMLKQVLPFLLGSSGLESAAQDVQAFSLMTLMDIIKKGSGKILRPFVADLVGKLLALLTSIEPGMVNYIYMNADKYGLSEQEIDDARLSSVKMSPMMEAIERCLDMLDDSVMPELETSLANAAKTVIGLPSRVGVCRVMVSLATRHRALFKPYAGGFLKLLRKMAMDRNDTIATSAAAASGYLSRLATDREILALIDFSKKTYFESEDDRHRTIAGELLLAVAKYATDRFASLASTCLPFAYFGLHDIYDSARDLFKAAWEENAGGSRAVLLYLREIIDLSVTHFESHRWSIKHAAAFTIADTVRTGSEISDSDAAVIWPALEKAIGGKTWEGKEKVLEAFVQFWKKSRLARSKPEIRTTMEKIIIREAKRNNSTYRVHGLQALAEFIEILVEAQPEHDIDSKWHETVLEIVDPVLEDLLNDPYSDAKNESMDIDAKTEGGLSSKDLATKTVANALRALMVSLIIEHSSSTPERQKRFKYVLDLLKKALDQPALTSRTNVLLSTALDAADYLFKGFGKARVDAEPELEEILLSYAETLLFRLSYDDLNEALRQKTASTAQDLAGIASVWKLSRLQKYLLDGASKLKASERSQTVLAAWAKMEGKPSG